MSLAVIIPNYNKEKYITKCIESVFAQTLQPTEVIVVDDCSTDNSIIILEELKAHFDTLKIIPETINAKLKSIKPAATQARPPIPSDLF